MKKTFLTFFVAVMAFSAYAQVSGGLKAGVNLASQKWEYQGVSITENGTSFHVGAYANFAVSDALSVQPELLFNIIKVSDDGEDLTLNYISVPIMLVYGFADNMFNVQAGPQIGLLLSSDPSEVKDEDGVKGTDFGLNVGAGANFGKVNLTLRYCLGLGNIAGDAFPDDFTIKNNVFQISVGVKLFGE
jgi:hypothetical protein